MLPPFTVRTFIGRPSSIDPANGFEHDGALLLRFIADPLVDYAPDTGATRPAAAVAWEVADDGREVVFRLRDGVRFHHGRLVTAEDYVYSLSRVANPSTGSKLSYNLACIEGYDEVRAGATDVLAGATAVDEATLRVRFSRPFYEAPALFGHRVTAAVPRELVEADPAAFAARPVSTGPYRMAAPWRPEDKRITLERFEQYHAAHAAFADGGAGHADQLQFPIHDDVEDAYAAWERGEIDVTKVPPARIGESLEYGASFRRTPCALMQYIGFPTKVAPFDDPVVRRAVGLALDRQALIDSAFAGTRQQAQRILPPMIRADDVEDLTGVVYDPAAGRRLLDERGVGPVETEFAFNAGLGHDRWVTDTIDQINRNLGWRLRPRPMEWREFLAWLRNASTPFRMTWAIDYPSVDNFLYPLFHPASVGDDNATQYDEPAIGELIDRARATADPADRAALYLQAESRVCADLPLLPLWFGVQYHLVALDRFEVGEPVVDLFGEPSLRTFKLRASD